MAQWRFQNKLRQKQKWWKKNRPPRQRRTLRRSWMSCRNRLFKRESRMMKTGRFSILFTMGRDTEFGENILWLLWIKNHLRHWSLSERVFFFFLDKLRLFWMFELFGLVEGRLNLFVFSTGNGYLVLIFHVKPALFLKYSLIWKSFKRNVNKPQWFRKWLIRPAS